ncbi:MAG: guanylate kinase [Simkaniaceae bacterium]|nr:guanylate kinase [Simkaniaceae bacterium]
MKLIGTLKRGLIFVVSAPAGTGKTTLTSKLYEEYKGIIVPSISCTTRPKRPGEVDGVHYFFLSEAEFRAKIEEGEFLEHTAIFGFLYGTLKTAVTEPQKKGQHVIMVIDTQGAAFLKKSLDATFIFFAPPSTQVLKERLVKRNTESEHFVNERLARAPLELSFGKEYDYIVVNDDLEIAYQTLKSIIVAEEHRSRYQYGLLNK